MFGSQWLVMLDTLFQSATQPTCLGTPSGITPSGITKRVTKRVDLGDLGDLAASKTCRTETTLLFRLIPAVEMC